MSSQRAMAGFARHNHVLALLFLIYDVSVAGLARLTTGKGHRTGRDLGHRSAPVVAVLPKTLRDDRGAQGYEYNHRYSDDYSKAEEMFKVLKHVRFTCARLQGAISPK